MVNVFLGWTSYFPPLVTVAFVGKMPGWVSVSIGNAVLLHLFINLFNIVVASRMFVPL